MGRRANDSGVRAPDTGSKKRFDVNRQIKEKTGKFNYNVGKRERKNLKAGKLDIVPKVSFLVSWGLEGSRYQSGGLIETLVAMSL
eukprot:751026-Hanusia_phi.AAC.5